jgi:P27 family predicted phage terminase small subunit
MSPMPAKSAEQHQLEGTRSQARPKPESVVREGWPKRPRGLSKEAQKVFRQMCRLLAERRALTRGDGELLRLYATSWDRQRQADAAIQIEGIVVQYTRLDSNGQPHQVEKPNINLAIAERAEKSMVAILDRLGLTPYHREKVKPAAHEVKQDFPKGSIGWLRQQMKEKEQNVRSIN